ncbi:MAG: hypothetical protein H0X30_32005 [Anaerolineae bacterium]|nr:hypothetical protein [Anaerolineae bacterium]
MFFQVRWCWSSILLVSIYLLFAPRFAAAQDKPPAPQFLYRSENHLVLLDGYAGKTKTLSIDVTEKDRFVWSPDGQYLVAQLYDGQNNGYCLNLYDVDKQIWTRDKPISCAVQEYIFTKDASQIYYSTNDKTNGILWKYNLKNQTNRNIYQTDNGNDHYQDGISDLKWSPTGDYLTFNDYHWIMGGTLNFLIVMNVESEKYSSLSARDPYYASYYPVWSGDDHWFLIILQDEYVTSGTFPETNHLGDVYLVNTDTGKTYRLTHTPAASEVDVHWTDDGKIAFTEVTEKKFTYTLDQAMNIEVVPSDKIITPEPADPGSVTYSTAGEFISPDPNLAAWVEKTQQADKTYKFALNIGDSPFYSTSVIKFSIPISDPEQSGTILIGWRPSDYPYPQG